MQTIHWLGAGLSSVPGIRRLANGDLPLFLWNRTVTKAEQALAGINSAVEIRSFDVDTLRSTIKAGDIVVSMLPGSWHVVIARMCIDEAAHFVSSSYISPEMKALHNDARQKGLCLVNEVGLDPGIDHLMAHALVNEYKQAPEYDLSNSVSFRSYCGGFPKIPNDFRYKFSWSPLGVLKALKTPSRSLKNGEVIEVKRPWHAISNYVATLPDHRKESFEAYPNRDALPFMQDYKFETEWQVEEFVRGTLRLNGWSKAWDEIFKEIEMLDGEHGEQRLQEMSDELWRTQAYDEQEPDRVVLCVEFEASNNQSIVWHKSYTLDSFGNAHGSAMARLVSLTVSLAVDAIATGKIAVGVTAAPSEPEIVTEWFNKLNILGEGIQQLVLKE
ncbi:MAG: saccharopine dehydrogenase [Pseudomonadales bacterium]|nr:saccharopine dehydrogenase [Pseudomonadales bacterium]